MTTIHTPTTRELALARDWHGGQASAMYAVASTGTLSRGTTRPSIDVSDGGQPEWRAATDTEWTAILLDRLAGELRQVVGMLATSAASDDPAADDLRVATGWVERVESERDALGVDTV